MQVKSIAVLSIYFYTFLSFSVQYQYPVGFIQTDGAEKLFFVKQLSSTNIELWSWNANTNQSHKELSSYFSPTNFRILPNNQGFSFLDNGRVRIKFFDKRSPRSIEIDQPVYQINYLNWKTSDLVYFHAKYGNKYGIFQIQQNEQCNCIVWQPDMDQFYPQVIDNTLFYIERSLKRGRVQYRIMSVPYPVVSSYSKKEVVVQILDNIDSFNEQVDISQKREIISFDDQPIAYLNMITKNLGLLVAYPKEIDDDSSMIRCFILCIYFYKNKWHSYELFSCDLSCDLLLNSKKRLYEGLDVIIYFFEFLKYWIIPFNRYIE